MNTQIITYFYRVNSSIWYGWKDRRWSMNQRVTKISQKWWVKSIRVLATFSRVWGVLIPSQCIVLTSHGIGNISDVNAKELLGCVWPWLGTQRENNKRKRERERDVDCKARRRAEVTKTARGRRQAAASRGNGDGMRASGNGGRSRVFVARPDRSRSGPETGSLDSWSRPGTGSNGSLTRRSRWEQTSSPGNGLRRQ